MRLLGGNIFIFKGLAEVRKWYLPSVVVVSSSVTIVTVKNGSCSFKSTLLLEIKMVGLPYQHSTLYCPSSAFWIFLIERMLLSSDILVSALTSVYLLNKFTVPLLPQNNQRYVLRSRISITFNLVLGKNCIFTVIPAVKYLFVMLNLPHSEMIKRTDDNTSSFILLISCNQGFALQNISFDSLHPRPSPTPIDAREIDGPHCRLF